MHSAVAEEIHQSGEYQCSEKEADDGPDIARLRSDRRVGGVQRVGKVQDGWPTLIPIPTPEGGPFKLRLSGASLRRAYLHSGETPRRVAHYEVRTVQLSIID